MENGVVFNMSFLFNYCSMIEIIIEKFNFSQITKKKVQNCLYVCSQNKMINKMETTQFIKRKNLIKETAIFTSGKSRTGARKH
jgi:hypothetical protein